MAAINEQIVTASGEPFLVRDRGLLEGACFRPINLFQYKHEEDVWTLAVALLFGLARNHPFQQGNKRTAFECAVLFLELNGYMLDAPDVASIADMIIEAILNPGAEKTFEHVVGFYVRVADLNEPASEG